RLGQDPPGVAQVGVDVVGVPLLAADQQCAGVGQDHRVVVHVDHVAAGRDVLRDLVGVVRGRDAGADVEELADPRLPGQVTHRAGQEGAVGADRVNDVRIGLDRLLTGRPVGGEIVLAAQPVVIDAGDVRHAGVEVQGHFAGALRGAVTAIRGRRAAFAGH